MNLKISLTLAVALLTAPVWLGAAPGAQAGVQDFTIPTFEADYYLSRDSDHRSHLRVQEHLIARFPEMDQNHGILRALPEQYQNHPLNLHIQSLTDDSGRPLNYSTSASNNNLELKIGDPSRYVHGLQSYNLAYTMDNVTSLDGSTSAFDWNTNGTQWQQPFGQVTARVHLTSDLAPTLIASSTHCYTGPQGSTAEACTITSTAAADGSTVTSFTATRPLEPGETLTSNLHFNPDTFAPYKISSSDLWRQIALLLSYLLPILLTLAIIIRQWRKYGRDPKGRGAIIAQFLPPAEISVLGASALLHEQYQPKAISAQIIDLAVRHYFKIYEISEKKLFQDKHSYEVELIRDQAGLRPEEAAVVALLFGTNATTGARINLDTLKNNLYTDAEDLGDSVNQQLKTAGYFRSDPASARAPYIAIGASFLILSIIFIQLTLSLLIPGIMLLLVARIMPARTQAGVNARDYLLGLKLYMKLAEADRLNVLQSPHGELTEKIEINDTTQLVKLYERLLPYAMLFGIEKDWAKEFAGLYQTPPDWYAGSAGFNAGYFAGSIGSFGADSTASFTAPSSSGSGGGFSGGGGGGGGGGGW